MGRKGKSGGPWDAGFGGNVIREDTAAERAKHGAEERRRQAKQAGRPTRRWGRIFVILVVLAGAGALAVRTRSSEPGASEAGSATTLPSAGSSDAAPPTTNPYVLKSQNYRPGDCVTWDQREADARSRPTDIVPCDQPHLLEITRLVNLTGIGTTYPDDDWEAIQDEHCRAAAIEFLGAPLDPSGLLTLTSLHPLPDGWAVGDRQLSCALGRAPVTIEDFALPAEQWVSYTGSVTDLGQLRLFPVGSCMTTDPQAAVPCTQSHAYEVIGDVDLTGRAPQRPSDEADWEALVRADCDARLVSYLGRAGRAGISAGWLTLSPEGWAAGGRIIQCTASRWNGRTRVPLDGPLRAVASA